MLSKNTAWKKIKEICEEKNITNPATWIGSTASSLNETLRLLQTEQPAGKKDSKSSTKSSDFFHAEEINLSNLSAKLIKSEEYVVAFERANSIREFYRDERKVLEKFISSEINYNLHEVLGGSCRLFLDLEKKGKNFSAELDLLIQDIHHSLFKFAKIYFELSGIELVRAEINELYSNRPNKASAHIIIKLFSEHGEISLGPANNQKDFWKYYSRYYKLNTESNLFSEFFDDTVYRQYGQMRFIYNSKKSDPGCPPLIPGGPVNNILDFFISHPKRFYFHIADVPVINLKEKVQVSSYPVSFEIIEKYLNLASKQNPNFLLTNEKNFSGSYNSEDRQIKKKINCVAITVFNLAGENDALILLNNYFSKLTMPAGYTPESIISDLEIYFSTKSRGKSNLKFLINYLKISEEIDSAPVKKIYFNSKYIDYSLFDAHPGRPVIIKSATGTGKTYGFYKTFKDDETLTTDYRKTLGQDKSANYNVSTYDEHHYYAQHFSSTIESLHKFDEQLRRCNIVFGDECEHAVLQLSNCKYPQKTINAYKYLFANKKVFLCSANAGPLTVEFCRDLGYEPIFYENTYKPQDKYYTPRNTIKEVINDIKSAVKKKEKILIFCSEKKRAKITFEYFREFFKEDEMLIMTSETPRENREVMKDINKVWGRKRFIIATSCVEAGVNYTRDDIKKVFGIFNNNSIPPISAYQMLRRSRQLEHVIFYAKDTNSGKLYEADVWAGFKWCEEIKKNKFILDKLDCKYDPEFINKMEYSTVNKILIRNFLFDHNTRAKMRSLLIEELEKNNFVLREEHSCSDPVDFKLAKQSAEDKYVSEILTQDTYKYQRLELTRFKDLGFIKEIDSGNIRKLLKIYSTIDDIISAFKGKEKMLLLKQYGDDIYFSENENGEIEAEELPENKGIPFIGKKYEYKYYKQDDPLDFPELLDVPEIVAEKNDIYPEQIRRKMEKLKKLSGQDIVIFNFIKEFDGATYERIEFAEKLSKFLLTYNVLINNLKSANRKKTEYQIKNMTNRGRILYLSPVLKLCGATIETEKISRYESTYKLKWLF